MSGRAKLIRVISFDDQNTAVKVRIVCQKPRGGRPHNRTANNNDVIVFLKRNSVYTGQKQSSLEQSVFLRSHENCAGASFVISPSARAGSG